VANHVAEATPPAVKAWQQHVQALIERQETHRMQAAIHEKNGMQPFIKTLASDEQYRAGLDLFRGESDALTVQCDPARDLGQHVLDGDLAIGIFCVRGVDRRFRFALCRPDKRNPQRTASDADRGCIRRGRHFRLCSQYR
jgi:hypothetical protein